MNIFEDYLNIVDYNLYDVLSTYEIIFNKLNINICKYEDDFSNWDNPEHLQEILKRILLYEAMEEGIISDELDTYEDFDLEDEFAISKNVEDYEQIIEDFYNWCGIKLNIF